MTQEERRSTRCFGRSMNRRALLVGLAAMTASPALAAIPRKPRRLSAMLHLRLVDRP